MARRGSIAVISSLNDRRVARSDRTADYRTLARWFATAPSAEEAHMLWRAAFCLTPARHLATTPETTVEDLVTPKKSWLDAEPLWISPRLRSTGYVRKPGRVPAIVDCSKEKREILIQEDEEAHQLQAARDCIATGKARRLSEFVKLDRAGFGLFLECIGAGLAIQTLGDDVVETASRDGTLLVRLERIPHSDPVRLETEDGEFSGPDYWLTIAESAMV